MDAIDEAVAQIEYWSNRALRAEAERDAAVADADTQRAAADEWQSRYEELLAERGVER